MCGDMTTNRSPTGSAAEGVVTKESAGPVDATVARPVHHVSMAATTRPVSRWSLWSENSLLSIGSKGLNLSIQ